MMRNPKERPILFSGPMVRAILNGTKAQTRRAVKHDPLAVAGLRFDGFDGKVVTLAGINSGNTYDIKYPYGEPESRLWVREAWRSDPSKCDIHYAAGVEDYLADSKRFLDREEWFANDYRKNHKKMFGQWRPSIHMPRWASRITLEVLDVRVQRVQEISEEDARAEGATEEFRTVVPVNGKPYGCKEAYHLPPSYYAGFANLWDSINAKRGYGWDVNPWVWVITFKAI